MTTAIPRAAAAAETGYTTHYQSNYYSCDDYHGNDDAESCKRNIMYVLKILHIIFRYANHNILKNDKLYYILILF